ncbi:hypothetical protein K6U06_10115 [Acidiferrimicrobium sp. IK]|uniref:hypothetical protein n=1 Tax=Acidiferrimicrobium sp. IK TaxID=2871700 RepID=UPI0021CB9658|nr:hypothetical protein [Acidiferrimicrobium sp. IK]MCU4184715.1 hypothetical protein [Acidiferrimicrobium sp. IK]
MRTIRLQAWALVVGAALAVAGCGGPTTTLVAPTTTATTMAPSATVPPLGYTVSVLPATAANATANARGACSRFSLLYIRLPQATVATDAARGYLAPVQQFADAAGAGDPAQWGQLRADVDGLMGLVDTPAWRSSTAQINLPAVQAVYRDCRSLE